VGQSKSAAAGAPARRYPERGMGFLTTYLGLKQKPFSPRWQRAFFLFNLLLLFTCCSFAFPQGSPDVRWAGTRLSVHAESVPLSRILNQIAVLTGLEIQGLDKASELTSVDFSNLSLREGLEQLLGDTDYAFILPGQSDTGKAGLLMIFRSHARTRRQTSEPRGISRTSARTQVSEAANSFEALVQDSQEDRTVDEQQRQLARLQLAAAQQDYRTLKTATLDPDLSIGGTAFELLSQLDHRETLDALLSVIKAGQGDSRLLALQYLTQARWADEEAVFSALSDSLKGQDIDARFCAIRALAERENPRAIDVLGDALNDPDPNVRLMVVQSLGRKQAGIPLLEKAAADADEMVSSAATQELNSFRSPGQ
jgi:hypothetical protein